MTAVKLGWWLGVVAGFAVFTVAAADSPPIYRCNRDGVVVFSDLPCGVDASLHESDGNNVTVYAAPIPSSRSAASRGERASARQSKSESQSIRRQRREADQLRRTDERRQAACAKLGQQLQDVRNKMRGGYGVSEGERLKSRQKQLDERRRREKCR